MERVNMTKVFQERDLVKKRLNKTLTTYRENNLKAINNNKKLMCNRNVHFANARLCRE